MKCSNTSCGWQGQGNFCESCGNKMIPDAPAEVFIICSGMVDGVACGAELKQSQNFCTTCGTRVDKDLFKSLQEKCARCGAILGLNCLFCAYCGLKRGSVLPLERKVLDNSTDGNAKEKESTYEKSTVSEISDTTTATLEGNGESCEILEESKLSRNEAEIESDKNTEIQDSETKSLNVEESESCTSSSASECGEQTADTSTRKKRKGGRKAESRRKREHKSKVHAEKYNLKKEELSELETNAKQTDDVEEEQTKTPETSKGQDLVLNREVCDYTNNNSVDNQTFVFGSNRQTEDSCGDSYDVVYPPDPTGPTFFLSGSSALNIQDSVKTDPLNDHQDSSTPIVDAPRETEKTQSNLEENANARTDEQLGEENKMQKDGKNKDEKMKSDTERGRKTYGSKQTETSKNNQASGNGQIDVVFHILVSTNMIKENRTVLLLIGAEEFGGWNNRKYVMRTVKRNPEFVEMSISLTMARYQLQRYIKYKYAVLKERSNQVEWEDYYCHRNADRYHNRRLHVDQHLLVKKEEWHQYDGVVTLKPHENLFKKIGNFFVGKNESDWEAHPEDFAKRLCPPWFKSDFRVMDTIQTHHESIYHLECLYRGLRKMYYVDSRTFQHEDAFAIKFAAWILTPLSNCLVRQESAYDGVCVTIIRALCVVVACDKLRLPLLEQTWQNICRCLLVHADTVNKTCIELKDILEYFPDRKYLANAVANFVKRVDRFGKNPSWLFCLPLIHLLEDLCKPFDKPTTQRNHSDKVPRWWGIVEVQPAVDSFKRNTHRWQISLSSILATMQPLFEMDFYLPRSIIACLKPVELREIIGEEILPVEVCCATLYCFIKSTNPSYYQGRQASNESDVIGEEKTVVECISKLKDRLQCYSLPVGSSRKQWWLAFMIAFECLQETVSTNRTSKVMPSAQIFLHCVSIYQRICNQDETEENKIETRQDAKHKELREKACDHVLTWLRSYASEYWIIRVAENLLVWNSAFIEQLKEEEIGINWNKRIANRLIENLDLQENTVTSTFLQHYCRNLGSYSGTMQDCLNKFALKAIEGGIDLDVLSLGDAEKGRFATLLSEMFQREWRTVDIGEQDLREERILKVVLSWSPFRQFMKSLYNNEKGSGYLSETCQKNLRSATAVVQTCAEAIVTGNIRIGTLKYIQRNKHMFCEVVQDIVQKKNEISRVISKAMDIRIQEVQAFEEQADKMKAFVDLCTHFPEVCIDEIEMVLQKQIDIEKYSVSEFCRTIALTESTIEKQYYPNVCAFNVPDTVYRILPVLKKQKNSFTFDKMWNEMCNGPGQNCTTLDDIVTMVWLPVKESWDQFVHRVDVGDILFQEFEKMIGSIYRNDVESMFAELKRMNIAEDRANERIEQLKQYRQLESCVNGAKVIIAFARRYRLTGDFKPVSDIAAHYNNDFTMNSFDQSLVKTCEFLKDITAERTRCLVAFMNCGNLVKWLQESMQELKQLKVFVELAFMSAGEEPMSIRKVECLHTAVTGYAPLIFELKPETGYVDLLDLCNIIWKELDATPNLPEMLVDTNRELEWLKDVEKSHGSVEVTSFAQVDAINSDGIFIVGRNVWPPGGKNNSGVAGDNSSLILDDVLRLTIRQQDGQRQQRDYTYTQLQDLTSRLMLVAGKAEKGNDKVEKFIMTFDGITRLCNVFTQLYAAGCVLFHGWTVQCLCDSKRPVALILQFGQGENVPLVKGRRSEREDLKDMVPELAKFMENCLKEWLQHIKEKRKEYMHLNYFTVDQLVILQRELVKVGTNDIPSHWIYPLLSAVKQNCSPADIVEAMAGAKDEIESQTLNVETADADIKTDDDMNADVKRKTFIEELVQSGYDEALAIKALEHVDPEEIDQGIVWCMEHDDSTDDGENQMISKDESPLTDASTDTSYFSGWSQSETSLQSMITSSVLKLTQQKKVGSKALLNKLNELWEEFLASITSNMRDYLSLQHLGLILRRLAAKNIVQTVRSLPPGFVEGQPNLVICPSADVIVTTLSVYMRDTDQPLPQSDEVLMCTAATKRDEVDIFWRRAIFGGSRKIHCLMNADMLDYDVSEASQRSLDEYLQDVHFSKDQKYRLLVICGTDNEYRSTIVSSLDKYKRQAPPINIVHLREYIASKLRADVSGVTPAACVDRERSTVRLVKSWRAGVGKTLFKKRLEENLLSRNTVVNPSSIVIPLHEKTINMHYVLQRLLEHTAKPEEITARLFHVDVAHEVEKGVDYLLFNLLIPGCLTDKTGFVWRKSPADIYLIETMPLLIQTRNRKGTEWHYVHTMLSILPDMICRSPHESLAIYRGRWQIGYKDSDQLFDEKLFKSPVFQRPFQYFLRLEQNRPLDDVQPYNAEGTQEMCLDLLLRHCGIRDPSWSEIHHFVWFLNTQLEAFEENNFVSPAAAENLPGFGTFLLRFLILMSRDFATRSLNISEESPGMKYETDQNERETIEQPHAQNNGNQAELQQYQMRRTWESSPHPYLFFNSDRATFTFLGFFIDKDTGNLVDLHTRTVLVERIMSTDLYKALEKNKAPLQEVFDSLPRHEKIVKLCKVMGIEMEHDPDDTYELTTDNVKKMLAIYMRFRCDIPVIIMGETGCGKTRLIKFMCSLQMPPGLQTSNMILMKVHGGTTSKDIIRKVEEAEKIAQNNREAFGPHMYTVLFFDEANTTEAIGLIKEIMCDKTVEGKKLKLCENLKIVAACNPYRKHADELIKKLEQAGLGYHVDADETMDRLGRVPMRRLVYRVQPLPQSLLPLVWDFGQLNTQVEDLYIRQMVRRYIREDMLPDKPRLTEVVSAILTASQYYMRLQKDECSFVSLRDVDRVLLVMSWFYEQSQGERTLYNRMDAKLFVEQDGQMEESFEATMKVNERVDDLTRSLVLALGVCYHACLKSRKQYRGYIARYFKSPCMLTNGGEQIKAEIECCQGVFLDHVQLEKHIARNKALKENVFMMVVCIELRIPLFLVGKPGSSKSLAKTIVNDAMQGNAARERLFRELKQAQMVSFQCSPLSTPDGIVSTFKQCSQFQKEKNLERFVSIVVLDEVGLAEDSPRMPLKTLHPLLEDGCQGDEKPEKYKKVAFIGISNWALDPAKMNRGILVQRDVPDLKELKSSARGICQTNGELGNLIRPLIEPLARSYLEIFEKASKQMREFFGLRDFYSLIKMVFRFVEKAKRKPTWHEMLHAIKRNFGGLDEDKIDPVDSFRRYLATIEFGEQSGANPDSSPTGLIEACLFDTYEMNSESRYLLLLTENYGALAIVQQQILSRSNRPITIFGSSFRSDQEYTQVCRNINKIKICMETGKTVVLLNLENLYESLYDALNQYYVYFGGARYVDLGLGTHRVKCPVHEHFRLIVVAEKQTVYKKFPIPLINRLEKHFLTISTMLTREQQEVVKLLENWTVQFSEQKCVPYKQRGSEELKTRVEDVFIGYHEDTCSSVVLHICEKKSLNGDPDFKSKVLKKGKSVLLWSATPDAVLRLKNSNLPSEERTMLRALYFKKQAHDSLMHYLNQNIVGQESGLQLLAQITTHSKLLTVAHKEQISIASEVRVDKILLMENLSSFDTEQQFSNKIRHHLKNVEKDPSLMVIQSDSGDVNVNLIACARYCVLDELEKMREEITVPVHVVFIVQLPRNGRFPGFQCGAWHSAHIDDLLPEDLNMPAVEDMVGRSAASLFKEAVGEHREYAEDVEVKVKKQFLEEREIPVEQTAIEDTDNAPTSELNEKDITIGSDESVSESVEEIHLDDVVLDVEIADEETQKISRNKLNMKALIMSCVQAALSIVKDKEENTRRETDRVTLILKLLDHEEDGHNRAFLHGICRLIIKMLEEKESEAVTGMAENWLITEAANLDNISKTGTLRRSCAQILENKVSPIFASIIAFLDTNSNLNLLDVAQNTWKRDLWLALLNTPESLNLQYTDMRHRDHNEVVVMTTGCEGHMFSARMPFSCLLIKQISEILQLEYPSEYGAGDNDSKAESCFRVLSKQPFHVVLNEVIKDRNVEEVVNDYIHDFVHSVYNPGSPEEQQLVCETVAYAANELSVELNEARLLLTLINVHIAHETLAPRLTYFRAMNSVCPECSSTILELKIKQPDHFMFQEYEFTFPAVCMLIEKLSPQRSELDQSLGRANWLNKVHKYRPVVEKVISLQIDQPLYGASSLQSLRRAKELWSRIVVVKLFLEHVCTADKKNKITIKYCMPLWTTLGDDTDMKQMKSFGKVERFLKSCNKGALKEYIGAEEKCSHCEQTLEGLPITLPCKDVLCDECCEDVKALGKYECTKCHQVVPPGFKYERQKVDGNTQDKLKDYQKRCNTFFMDVVSQLCFADNTAPSQEVIDRLLGYVFFKTSGQNQRTRDWTIFNTGIDPNPVFRSFLLQLLIRSSKDGISKNLEAYLSQAKTLINNDPLEQDRHYIELSILIIQCLEDMCTEQANVSNQHEADVVIQALKRARQTIEDPNLSADKLYGLACARMGLAKAAKYIAKVVVDGVETRAPPVKVRRVIEAAQNLCEDTSVRWTRIYLVKYLCRCYGVDVYRSLCRSRAPFLRWIAIKDMNIEKVVEVSDRYVVCGQSYINIREAMTKAVLGESVEHLKELLQELQNTGIRAESLFTIAVHREVTSSYLYPPQQRKLTEEVRKTLIQLISDCQAVRNKTLLNALVKNELVQRHLRYVEGEGMHDQGMQCLVVHFQSVLSHLKGDRTLLQPLLTLIYRPQAYLNCFLPTMPQDDLDEVKEALLAARNQIRNADENPVFYRCPNGHPYVIGNCGRAVIRANCRECGTAIGGQGHRLLPGNTKDRGIDNTVTGHILGRAEARGRGPKPERLLTPAYCATVRCLVHIAMLVGAGNNLQGVQMLIKPDIEEDQVEQFLWRHIKLDIEDIQRALNRSADDVLLFMHTIIDCIFRTHHEGEQVRDEVWQLRTKRGREQWENNFSSRFIRDILQTLEATMKSNNQLLAEDKRLGADPLLCLLYETDSQQEKESSAQLQNIPRVWRYRTPISLQHLRQEVEAKIADARKHKILKLFLEEEHHLRAIRCIPSILQLHRALLGRYQKKVDKAEASSVTVEMLAQEQVAGTETELLLQDFIQAWELVRNNLKMYLCPTELGGMAVPKEYCNMSINDKTPLSMLLPTEKEIGLCSYALLDFLMRKQNDFLDKYVKEINREPSVISKILPREVTTSHLISYDSQQDLLPLVLANCHYSFEMGKGTKIEYDFTGLERQLMDRFLFSKSMIDVGRVLKIDMMVYRTEITDAAVFKKLADKIPQVVLDSAVKSQICNDIRHLPDLCQSLAYLDITISFLKSTGGQPEQNVHEFMVKTLQMEFSVHSRKAQQVCQFRHLQSLWLLLCLQKAKKMTEADQHSTAIFESVSQEFHEDIPDELMATFQGYMKQLNIDKLTQLVEAIHEFILLVVAVKQNMDDSDAMNTTENKLGEWLFGYIDSLDSPNIDLAVLRDFPGELLFRHSINTWITAYRCLKVKESGAFKRF